MWASGSVWVWGVGVLVGVGVGVGVGTGVDVGRGVLVGTITGVGTISGSLRKSPVEIATTAPINAIATQRRPRRPTCNSLHQRMEAKLSLTVSEGMEDARFPTRAQELARRAAVRSGAAAFQSCRLVQVRFVMFEQRPRVLQVGCFCESRRSSEPTRRRWVDRLGRRRKHA